ncbi:MAG: GNAT family N-acetyltransferase [Bacteroidia bacterium]
MKTKFKVVVADDQHHVHATTIVDEMEASAKVRGTGIARRSPEFISKKMTEGKAVIALTSTGKWAGFCYIESWSHDQFVANSGLIVHPDYRKSGLAKEIKIKIFQLSRKRFPKAKIFGLTTGLAVMKINSDIGYEPVTYQELTNDEDFWKGCQSCVNFPILQEKQRKNCMCTAMLYDPNESVIKKWKGRRLDFLKYSDLYERYMRIKRSTFLNIPFKLNEQKKDHDQQKNTSGL